MRAARVQQRHMPRVRVGIVLQERALEAISKAGDKTPGRWAPAFAKDKTAHAPDETWLRFRFRGKDYGLRFRLSPDDVWPGAGTAAQVVDAEISRGLISTRTASRPAS